MSSPRDTRTVMIDGKGTVILRPSDHIATGGEGSVYRMGDLAVKLFTDEKKMVHDNMEGKIKLLAPIGNEMVIAPERIVRLPSGVPVGYAMPLVRGEPLPRLFTNDYRAHARWTDADVGAMVERMREVVIRAHDHKAIMVDANEFAWLMAREPKRGPVPKIVDVDSWAIGSWKPQVIMPSIRDWQTKGFTEGSDWFSWGIVTFQLYTGIHPYKGTLDGFTRSDLEGRMKARASVFRKEVRLNGAVRDFSLIPKPLADWYRTTFEEKIRTAPPSPLTIVSAIPTHTATTHTVVVNAKDALEHKRLYDSSHGKAVKVYPCGVLLTDTGKLIDVTSKRILRHDVPLDAEVVSAPQGWLVAVLDQERIALVHIDDRSGAATPLTVALRGEKIWRAHDRLFVIHDDQLTELTCVHLGKPIASVGNSWSVMPAALHCLNGVAVQDTLGAAYVLFPSGKESVTQIRVRELDRKRVVTGTAAHRAATFIAADRTGTYTRYDLVFDAALRTYQCSTSPADAPELNATMLERGVVAEIPDDGSLLIRVPTTGAVKEVKTASIRATMRLTCIHDLVVYLYHGELWSLRSK